MHFRCEFVFPLTSIAQAHFNIPGASVLYSTRHLLELRRLFVSLSSPAWKSFWMESSLQRTISRWNETTWHRAIGSDCFFQTSLFQKLLYLPLGSENCMIVKTLGSGGRFCIFVQTCLWIRRLSKAHTSRHQLHSWLNPCGSQPLTHSDV